jgi:hypothetical protein
LLHWEDTDEIAKALKDNLITVKDILELPSWYDVFSKRESAKIESTEIDSAEKKRVHDPVVSGRV